MHVCARNSQNMRRVYAFRIKTTGIEFVFDYQFGLRRKYMQRHEHPSLTNYYRVGRRSRRDGRRGNRVLREDIIV